MVSGDHVNYMGLLIYLIEETPISYSVTPSFWQKVFELLDIRAEMRLDFKLRIDINKQFCRDGLGF